MMQIMIRPTDTELDDLEAYLVGLDETGSTLASEWIADSPHNWDSEKKAVHKALQDLLHDAVILSKD